MSDFWKVAGVVYANEFHKNQKEMVKNTETALKATEELKTKFNDKLSESLASINGNNKHFKNEVLEAVEQYKYEMLAEIKNEIREIGKTPEEKEQYRLARLEQEKEQFEMEMKRFAKEHYFFYIIEEESEVDIKAREERKPKIEEIRKYFTSVRDNEVERLYKIEKDKVYRGVRKQIIKEVTEYIDDPIFYLFYYSNFDRSIFSGFFFALSVLIDWLLMGNPAKFISEHFISEIQSFSFSTILRLAAYSLIFFNVYGMVWIANCRREYAQRNKETIGAAACDRIRSIIKSEINKIMLPALKKLTGFSGTGIYDDAVRCYMNALLNNEKPMPENYRIYG